ARGGCRRIDAGEVADWLEQVVATPRRAPSGEIVRLAEVPSQRQVRELDFLVAGAGVSDRAVIEAVDAEFGLDVVAGGARWSGFLRGFIDLVFEHGGRYYLLDWKSNHLGDTVRHYAAGALATAMRRHAYPLQASLYTLALHRWLRRRLPAYDYDRDFGGVFYVFLRGAGLRVPGGDASGAEEAGVHASRPSRALIDRLDDLFAAAPRGARGSPAPSSRRPGWPASSAARCRRCTRASAAPRRRRRSSAAGARRRGTRPTPGTSASTSTTPRHATRWPRVRWSDPPPNRGRS